MALEAAGRPASSRPSALCDFGIRRMVSKRLAQSVLLMSRLSLAVLLVAFAGTARANPIDPQSPSFNELRAITRTELARRNIPETEIRRIDLHPQLGSALGGLGRGSSVVVVGWDAWVRIKSCQKGYVVVSMSRHGFVRQSYAFGPCEPPGF